MPDYKAPSIDIADFDAQENEMRNREIATVVDIIAGAKNNALDRIYTPPKFEAVGLSADENAALNEDIAAALRAEIEGAGSAALIGPVAAAVIGAVVGSVASTIVSKKLDAGVALPDDFRIDVIDAGGFISFEE
jgi:predicted transcriptional regulator